MKKSSVDKDRIEFLEKKVKELYRALDDALIAMDMVDLYQVKRILDQVENLKAVHESVSVISDEEIENV